MSSEQIRKLSSEKRLEGRDTTIRCSESLVLTGPNEGHVVHQFYYPIDVVTTEQ